MLDIRPYTSADEAAYLAVLESNIPTFFAPSDVEDFRQFLRSPSGAYFVGQVGGIRKIKGVLVHPAQVKTALGQFPELGNFQIVVDHPQGARYDHAVIRIGCDAPRADLATQVRERLKSQVLIQMDVELVPRSEIAADDVIDKR